jgi:hypothetical protein
MSGVAGAASLIGDELDKVRFSLLNRLLMILAYSYTDVDE